MFKIPWQPFQKGNLFWPFVVICWLPFTLIVLLSAPLLAFKSEKLYFLSPKNVGFGLARQGFTTRVSSKLPYEDFCENIFEE